MRRFFLAASRNGRSLAREGCPTVLQVVEAVLTNWKCGEVFMAKELQGMQRPQDPGRLRAGVSRRQNDFRATSGIPKNECRTPSASFAPVTPRVWEYHPGVGLNKGRIKNARMQKNFFARAKTVMILHFAFLIRHLLP